METDKVESLLTAYETDVRFPDTSSMEHFDMLLSRTRLENNKQLLTAEQKDRLAAADEQMARQLDAFYAAIVEVADLADGVKQLARPQRIGGGIWTRCPMRGHACRPLSHSNRPLSEKTLFGDDLRLIL